MVKLTCIFFKYSNTVSFYTVPLSVNTLLAFLNFIYADNGKGSCARIVYGPDFYQVAMTCYGNALANRVVAGFGLINVTADKCL